MKDERFIVTYRIEANSYEEAKSILSKNRDKLDKVAAVLIEKEKITGDEFDQIFAEN